MLLLGGGVRTFGGVDQWLTRRGCQCSTAASFSEACALLREQSYNLVLSASLPHQGGSLLGLMMESQASLFYCHPVEDGCWWIPVLRRGGSCLGAPAQPPVQFARTLGDLLSEVAPIHAAHRMA